MVEPELRRDSPAAVRPAVPARLVAGLVVTLACLTGAAAAAPPDAAAPAAAGSWVHAMAMYGTPNYPENFTHFDYVNPDAPKGGTLYLPNPDRRTSFDKFNPYTTRGNAPAGMRLFMFETLCEQSFDEPETMYGLLAGAMRVDPNNAWIEFRLRDEAHFSDGTPVLADDVKFSFSRLVSAEAFPGWRSTFADVRSVDVLDPHTIRFELKTPNRQLLFDVGTSLPVFSRSWGRKPDGSHLPFDQVTNEIPITSGPYIIGQSDSGRRIEFVRDPHYWASALPCARGMYNFERIVYRYYLEQSIAFEAFKAGEFDVMLEYSARRWVVSQAGAKYRAGDIIKAELPSDEIQAMEGYDLNLRRPLFQDARVRAALDLTFDYEHLADKSFHQYKRIYSLFSNSEFAAEGLPSEAELALLEPYRSQLDARVFGPAWRPPRTDERPNQLRENLLAARDLLAAAGWKVAADGVLRNSRGEPFEFEYLEPEAGANAEVIAWQRNLDRLGIRLNERVVDFAIYAKRLDEFDFDMVTINPPAFAFPSAQTLVDAYGSKNADIKGSNNFVGIKNPVLDALFQKIAAATTLDELRTACRAADRVFMWETYIVPRLYLDHARIAYWKKLGVPAVAPRHGLALSWALYTWWIKPGDTH